MLYNNMSGSNTTVKSKTNAFRVTETDFQTLSEFANRLRQMGQINHNNPHVLAKEYTFAFANIIRDYYSLSIQVSKCFSFSTPYLHK
jgi:hypothetical protein